MVYTRDTLDDTIQLRYPEGSVWQPSIALQSCLGDVITRKRKQFEGLSFDSLVHHLKTLT